LILLTVATLRQNSIEPDERQSPDEWLTVWAGMLPIILSAPHGGRDTIPGVAERRGIGVAQFTVERDSNTAELAESLAARIAERLGAKPFLVVARFERKYADANRAEGAAFESAEAKSYYDAYHRAMAGAVAKVRQTWSGGLLLDIHGQRAEAGTIFRGTDNRKSVAALERRFGTEALIGTKSILGQMALKGYRVEPGADHSERRYTGGYTTRMYGSHRDEGVDAIQLEFGAGLRARRNIERTAGDLAHGIEIFSRNYLPPAKGFTSETAAMQP
jgi:N-formylglutamate amidohydrolase